MDSRHKAYPNYELPYRGIPAEIRTMIWREYLTQRSKVSGPYLELVPESSDEAHYTSKVFCVFQPELNLQVFSVSKEVNREATSACNGTLELIIDDNADRFTWFLSFLSKQFRSRIGKLETTFKVDCCSSPIEICDWLEPLSLLQLDVLTLGFQMRAHPCRRLTAGHTWLGNYLSALDRNWSEDDISWAISPFRNGRVMQIKFRFINAPRELEFYLNTVAKCLQVLRIDHEINEGNLHQREFEISPLNEKGEVVLTRTQVGLAKTSNAANKEHLVEI